MTAVNNLQPLLGLNMQIDNTATAGAFGLGAISIYGFNFNPRGEIDTGGQLLSIADNGSLFDLIGAKYGGDGITTFQLPDLDDQVMIGQGTSDTSIEYTVGETVGADSTTLTLANLPANLGGTSEAIDNHQPSLTITYAIRTEGTYPSRSYVANSEISAFNEDGFLAEVRAFAMEPEDLPFGWTAAEGQQIPIAQNTALFSLLGTNFGGDGRTYFNLPDLSGRAVIGEGQGPGLPYYRLGQKYGSDDTTLTGLNLPAIAGGSNQSVSNEQPTQALNYIVALQGVYPSRSFIASEGSEISATENSVYVGEILMFAGNFAPRGFAFADGQLLSITQNTALFSLYGTTYGGDGRTTFALPDLRGRVAVDEGTEIILGEKLGSGSTLLSSSNLPVFAAAQDDEFSMSDGGSLGVGQSLISNNGNGADLATTLIITKVEGEAANVGTIITLASGATLQVNAAGSFDYSVAGTDFELLRAGETATDTFTYELGATSTATVTVTITGDDNEKIIAGDDADSINAGVGNDTIFGNGGVDHIEGGSGNDTMFGGVADDIISGSEGNDYIGGGGSADWLFGGDDEDIVLGGGGGDTINGDGDSDSLYGGQGDDIINGGSGNDFISGAKGIDTIDGGSGNDTLIGGAGFDVFVFQDGFGEDVILDYAELKQYEDIDLSGVSNIGSYGDLVKNHMRQVGDDVVITDGLDSITIKDALIADMNYADFIF